MLAVQHQRGRGTAREASARSLSGRRNRGYRVGDRGHGQVDELVVPPVAGSAEPGVLQNDGPSENSAMDVGLRGGVPLADPRTGCASSRGVLRCDQSSLLCGRVARKAHSVVKRYWTGSLPEVYLQHLGCVIIINAAMMRGHHCA
jgi:hypothetical protein